MGERIRDSGTSKQVQQQGRTEPQKRGACLAEHWGTLLDVTPKGSLAQRSGISKAKKTLQRPGLETTWRTWEQHASPAWPEAEWSREQEP